MSNWTITVPEATTNIILNSSLEYDAIGATSITSFSKVVGTETYLLDNTYSHHGIKSVKIVTAASADSGIGQDVSATTSASTQYTLSCYAIGTGTVKLFFYDNGSGGSQISATYTLTSSWQRFTLTKTFGNGAFRLVGITTTAATAFTFWVDDFQLEQKDHATTYCDGDQAGCTWAGLRHGSTSSRAANYRLAGREYDIQTQYGLRVRQFSGAGVPDYELMTQDLALQPGSVFLRDKINARVLTLVLDNNSPTAAGLHSKRKAFWNVIKPDAFGQSQPFLIGYSGAASGKTVYGAFRYAGGWGLSEGMNGGANTIEAGGAVGLRLLEVDPFWYADDQESATLDFTDDITSNYGPARISGAWQALGSGFDATIYRIVADKNSGRVYFGGAFGTANGVAVNGITYWNGSTFVAMGGTAGVAGGYVLSMAIASNGDLWVGGSFTSAGGSTADGLARWNYAAGNWTCFTNGTPGNIIYAIAIDKNGLVYIGGDFTNWDGNANEDYIASYNGSAFAPLSTGTNGVVRALKIGIDGTTLYVGGLFTTPQTRIMSWDGSAFSAMGSGASGSVFTIETGDNGNVYAGGAFTSTPTTTRIAMWNGSAWYSLGTGVAAGDVYRIYNIGSGVLLVSGAFTSAGGLSTAYCIAYWNGSSWLNPDIKVLAGTTVFGVASLNGNIYTGLDTAGVTAAGRTTVTVLSTAPVYPVITITGTTTAASTSTLQWLENQTTGERLYFNLTINTGEIITIDLRPTSRKVTSNWRGQIFDQPLPTSDFSSWHLVSGSNTVAAFMTGTVTGATMTMNWQKIHASIDGEAA